MSEVKIVLADDHQIVRSALRVLLEDQPDFHVVAEAGDVETALRFIRPHRPDVLILDLHMPGPPTLPAIARIHELSPDTRVLMLTMEHEPGFARQAMQAGASGYVVKDAADSELVHAVRLLAAGHTYLDPGIGGQLAAELPPAPWPPDGLSERELEVLGLVAFGHTNKDIGNRLSISVRTVEAHRIHIHRKLGIPTRAGLVRYALDLGLIAAPPDP